MVNLTKNYRLRLLTPWVYDRSSEKRALMDALREYIGTPVNGPRDTIDSNNNINSELSSRGVKIADSIAMLVLEATGLNVKRFIPLQELTQYSVKYTIDGAPLYMSPETLDYLEQNHSLSSIMHKMTLRQAKEELEIDPTLRFITGKDGMLILRHDSDTINPRILQQMHEQDIIPYRTNPYESSHFFESLLK